MQIATTTSSTSRTAILTAIGGRISRLRKARGWSQLDLAIAADVSTDTIRKVEADSNTHVKILEKIARALECELEVEFREKQAKTQSDMLKGSPAFRLQPEPPSPELERLEEGQLV